MEKTYYIKTNQNKARVGALISKWNSEQIILPGIRQDGFTMMK